MPQAFEVDDLYLHAKVASLHTVPGAASAVADVRTVDRENNRYASALWRCPMDGSPPRQLTGGGHLDSSPRLSPDSRWIAFVSDRGDTPSQLHMIPLDGATPRQVGTLPGGVEEIRWRPDSARLVVTAEVPVDPDLRGRRGPPPGERPDDAPEVVWRLPYKLDGSGYILAREVHLFDVDLASSASRQLTDGAFDVMGFDVHPDGERIAYSRTREGRFAHCTDLWVRDSDGTDTQLTTTHATVMSPVWSPDGASIAFTGAVLEGDAEPRLWRFVVATGQVLPLSGDTLDVADPTSLCWSPDSRRILFVDAHEGRQRIAAVDVADASLSVIRGGDRQVAALAWNHGKFLFAVDHPAQPSEIWWCDGHGAEERQASDFNPWWRDRAPISVEARRFDVPDGSGGTESVEGWLLRPAGATTPGPLLDDLHGGPASYALFSYDSNVFWQVLCSAGWSVLLLNSVGSSSYGRAFCRRLSGHWGELDWPQHVAALEQLKRDGVCDDRIAVSGKSYGGYLSGWATAHHTGLVKAAVVMAPVGNIETHYGTSDGGYYSDPVYVGTAPEFDREVARRLSPLQYIHKSRTPTLFLQGKEDERCPKCQAEELFVTHMCASDTPGELVLYPNEGHSFLASGMPRARADASRRIVDWVRLHTEGAAP